ncbi:MAG: prepilin-type N-terminal cleavage/methylation domain-containing protein, partial [Pseudomonadota bacterium]
MENTSLSTNYVGKAKSSRNLGFTLIELSIVLVIIGQDLIYAASVRSQIKQIEEIETQINTFKLKYN